MPNCDACRSPLDTLMHVGADGCCYVASFASITENPHRRSVRTPLSTHRAQVILRSGRSRITCASQLYLRTPCSAPPPFFSRTACAPALRPTPNSPIHPSSSPFLTVGVRSIETSWDGARQIPWLCSPPFPPLHIPAPLALYAHTWFRAPRLCGYNPYSTLRASSISPSPLQLKQ